MRTGYVAVPIWAVQEALADHQDDCQLCLARLEGGDVRCQIATVLGGALEDLVLPDLPEIFRPGGVRTPVHIGEVVPDVIAQIEERNRDAGPTE